MECQVTMRMGIRWRHACARIKGRGDEWIDGWTSTALHVGWTVDKVSMGMIRRTMKGDLRLAMILWPSGTPSLVMWQLELCIHQGCVSSPAQLVWDRNMVRSG